MLGKNAAWEFAHGRPSWNILFPSARNPWNTDYSPAGSSSGSAAAIAAELTLGAMGTNTAGRSAGRRRFVAWLKPTYGLVNRCVVIANCFSHDQAGPMAWTTADAAILLQAVAGYDEQDIDSVDVMEPDYTAALIGNVPSD